MRLWLRLRSWLRKLLNMRRRISLYIGGELADLNDDGLILYNYTMEEAENPAIVRNSYTQTIELPGTPNNNRIFGHLFRPDRISGAGQYNPSRKVDFAIYNEMSEIVESGYVKLDSVNRKDGVSTYSVTLYGGLGSFLYGLSFDSEGNKRTLADLAYTAEGALESELDFTITKEAVLDAWKTLNGGTTYLYPTQTYNRASINEQGELDGGERGLFVCSFNVSGLAKVYVTGESPYSVVQIGALASALDAEGNVLQVYEYDTHNTYTDFEITLPDGAVTLYVCGDEFDYPARAKASSPVWNVLNFAPCYNGLPSGSFAPDKAMVVPGDVGLTIPAGYTAPDGVSMVTLSRKYTEWETHDLRSYLQRPVIRMQSIIEAICQPYNNGGWEVELDPDFFSVSNPYWVGTWLTLPIISSVDVQSKGVEGAIRIYEGSEMAVPDGGATGTEYTIEAVITPRIVPPASADAYYLHCYPYIGFWRYLNVIQYTLKAYDEDGNVVAQVTGNVSSDNPDWASEEIGAVGHFGSDGSWVGDDLRLKLSGYGISYITLEHSVVSDGEGSTPPQTPYDAYLWTNPMNFDSHVTASSGYIAKDMGSTYSYKTADSARSGSVITKRMLLSSDHTPADYLLSFAKTFGLVFVTDKAEKKVTIMHRKDFYTGNVVDLTNRVDLSQGWEVVPFGFSSKWYDWQNKNDKGEFAKYYKSVYGKTYGRQRVDTGTDFDAEATDVMKDIAFQGCCEVMEKSTAFCNLDASGTTIPAVFLDGGTYALDKSGETEERNISIPAGTTRTWWNDIPGWDEHPRPQFHDGEKGDEGRDVLLFLDGINTPEGIFHVTDDTPLMLSKNGNVPCWLLEPDDADSIPDAIPNFSRYKRYGGGIVRSLDFGNPEEVQLPEDTTFAPDCTIFERYWKRYITDRYDDDARILRCRADLSGLKQGQEMLRDFYFFKGSIWALNKVENMSLTTWDTTEIELVRVIDPSNYTS